MRKNLSEMSLEELWQLFPIVLVEHQECWKNWYLEEETLLKNALSKMYRISHIGSTSIPTIWSKPIIDILVEIPREDNLFDYKDLIIKKAIFVCHKVRIDYLSIKGIQKTVLQNVHFICI